MGRSSSAAAATRELVSAVRATGAGDLRGELVSAPYAPSTDAAERLHHTVADLAGPVSGASPAVEVLDADAQTEPSWLLTDFRGWSDPPLHGRGRGPRPPPAGPRPIR